MILEDRGGVIVFIVIQRIKKGNPRIDFISIRGFFLENELNGKGGDGR